MSLSKSELASASLREFLVADKPSYQSSQMRGPLPVLVDLDSKRKGAKEADILSLALKKGIRELPALW